MRTLIVNGVALLTIGLMSSAATQSHVRKQGIASAWIQAQVRTARDATHRGVMKPTRTPSSGPRATLGEWRRRRLLAAGLDEQLAEQLADDDAGVDLHELLVLLDRGCPPTLAARILAPLEHPAP